MTDLLAHLLPQRPVITDGGWGTQLQALGLPIGEMPDSWNLERADAVLEVAQRYVDAGSRIILTNTFRANRIAMSGHRLEEEVENLNRAGVRISREAAGDHVKVFASMGPSGKMLMAGEISADELRVAFEEQAGALAAAGADAIVVETMSDLEEASIAVRAAKLTGLPVVGSLVFDSGRDRDRTMMGATPEQVAAALEEAGADVIGANCGLGMEGFVPIARRLLAATRRPIWVKPNAGLPEMELGNVVYRTTPTEFASFAPTLVALGVSFIGGCCGTTPEFIRELIREVGR